MQLQIGKGEPSTSVIRSESYELAEHLKRPVRLTSIEQRRREFPTVARATRPREKLTRPRAVARLAKDTLLGSRTRSQEITFLTVRLRQAWPYGT